MFIDSQSQQINPVPDYVFQNRMSVGRTAVTDTAAYFSIGPRYGAIRGFMPPMVIDTASVTGTKRNGLLIFSIQKNKFLYWDSVRVQWSDMAGSSGSYITGTLTNRYIPKATGTTTLGNSLMYDSSSHVRAYGNWIGNNNSSRFLFQTEIDGQNGYGLKVQQNDSNDNNIQYVTTFRHGLVTSAKPRPEFGVGHDMSVPDDAGTFRRIGTILTRLTDTTAAGISAKMQFGVAKSGSIVTPLQIYSDSSVRMAKLAGSGSRYVVADANGDLTATSATTSTIGGSGTTNYIPKFTASGTIGNSVAYDNGGTELLVNTTSDAGAYALQVAGSIYNTTSAFFGTTSGGISLGTTNAPSVNKFMRVGTGGGIQFEWSGGLSGTITSTNDYDLSINNNNATLTIERVSGNYIFNASTAGRVGIGTTSPSYKLDITGDLRTTTGANFATSSGEVLIGTTTDVGDYKLQVSGAIYNSSNALLNAAGGETWIGGTDYGAYQLSVTNNMYVDGLAILAGNGVAEVRVGTTTDAGVYRFQVDGAIYNTTTITTGAPTSGSAKPWRLGEAATVSPTSPNRTIRVEIDGTVYYIHAKTTND